MPVLEEDSVAYMEVSEFSGWFFPKNLDTSDRGAGWAFVAESNHCFYVLFLSFKDGFNLAVAEVSYPSSYVTVAGSSPCLMSKEDPLNISADKDMGPNFQADAPQQSLQSNTESL